jgi:hypothetical protein
MAFIVAPTRIERLSQDFKLVSILIENNASSWTKKELNAALFGFCMAKVEEDILYQLTVMSGRHPDLKDELKRLIESLKEKE